MAKLLPKQYAKILYESTKGLKGAELESVTKRFITFLRENQMVSKVKYIMKEFERHAKKEEGVEIIEITSARELSQTQIKEVSKNFGKNVEATTIVDPELIGGIMVRTENTILDGSIRGQLEKMKTQL